MATRKKVAKKAAPRKKAASKATIEVTLARLASGLEVREVAKGTSVSQFLALYGLTYSAAVRVNAKSVLAESVLKEGDIVTIVAAVSGGAR